MNVLDVSSNLNINFNQPRDIFLIIYQIFLCSFITTYSLWSFLKKSISINSWASSMIEATFKIWIKWYNNEKHISTMDLKDRNLRFLFFQRTQSQDLFFEQLVTLARFWHYLLRWMRVRMRGLDGRVCLRRGISEGEWEELI